MNEIIQTVVPAIATLLGGGLIGKYFAHQQEKRKQGTSEFRELMIERKNYTTELSERIDELEKLIETQTQIMRQQSEEINKLRMQLITLENSANDAPLPIWLKDNNGYMIFLNSYYEDMFLTPAGKTIDDYIGKSDVDVWGEEIGEEYRGNDLEVHYNRKAIRYVENVKVNGVESAIEVLKYPRFYKNQVIGIGGLVLRTAASKEELCG
jgi:PAS domain-containing protein